MANNPPATSDVNMMSVDQFEEWLDNVSRAFSTPQIRSQIRPQIRQNQNREVQFWFDEAELFAPVDQDPYSRHPRFTSIQRSYHYNRLRMEQQVVVTPIPAEREAILNARLQRMFGDHINRVIRQTMLVPDDIIHETNNVPPTVGDRQPLGSHYEAQDRATKLLRENLTEDQRASLDKDRYFDVTGQATGKRYRILSGRINNVLQLSNEGKIEATLCFAPAGDLPLGDVLLAQKLALENFELEALEKANVTRHPTLPSLPTTGRTVGGLALDYVAGMFAHFNRAS